MKKITIFAALAAVGLSSCSINQVQDVASSSDNVDNIGISTGVGTTRGTDMVGSSLQNNDINLSYADSDGVYGSLNFTYNNEKGEWNDNTAGTTWADLALPVVFYSFCDENGDVEIGPGFNSAASTATEYAVSNINPEKHSDLLYMGDIVSAVPAAGKVYSTFKHALSKVDLVSKVGINHVVANYIAFSNLQSTGVPAISATVMSSDLKWTAGSQTTSYENINKKIALSETARAIALTESAIISNVANTTASRTANMKLIPQTIEGDYADLQAAIKSHQADESYATADYSEFKYIEVMYRMKGPQNEGVIGYENAAYHPNFKKTAQEVQDKYNGKPLYVRGAFVMSNDLALKVSSYYKLNLNFNTFGGLLMDDYYYDQNGDRTEFKVLADIETGDPIIPGDDTVIGITVVVDEWTTESDTDMQ